MKDDGTVPWLGIALLFTAAVALNGCSGSGIKIGVVQPDVTLTPPAALMQPPQPLKPVLWTSPTDVPMNNGSGGTISVPITPKQKPVVTVAPIQVAPTPLIPPAPSVSSQETGKAPMPGTPK
jgi:hypothetical protein